MPPFHTQESIQIVNNFGFRPIMVTMNGHLLVIGNQRDNSQVMMSFASPGTTIGTRLKFTAESLISHVYLSLSAYGVLNSEENVKTLIVAGQYRGQMYCESYVIKSDSYKVKGR